MNAIVAYESASTTAINNEIAVQREQNQELMKIVIAQDGGIEKMEKFMAMQERFEDRCARKLFYSALAEFQNQCPPIQKKGLVSHAHKQGEGMTEYSFAKLEDIIAQIKEPLAACGLSYRWEQTTDSSAGTHAQLCITVKCIVTHIAGHSESTQFTAYPDSSGKKNAIQEIASTDTYLRRYTLTGGLGLTVSDEDHDGQTIVDGDVYSEDVVLENGYTDDEFGQKSVAWIAQIKDNGKTAQSMTDFLFQKKGKQLTDAQFQILVNAEPK